AEAERARHETTAAREALDRLRGEVAEVRLALAAAQARVSDLAGERDNARAEAAEQRERAVAAELRPPRDR
ncbi:MAG TPA: hypothetical protein VGP70_25265, partial [Actinomadura sp.]|nr:hypothetical protein [Actinomadura sp.]